MFFSKVINWLTGGSASGNGSSASKSLRELEGFVDYVVRALVDYPDEIVITSTGNDEGAVIQIRCRKEDIGKIVGKRGKTIMAIRSLVSGAAGRQGRRVSVDVLD